MLDQLILFRTGSYFRLMSQAHIPTTTQAGLDPAVSSGDDALPEKKGSSEIASRA